MYERARDAKPGLGSAQPEVAALDDRLTPEPFGTASPGTDAAALPTALLTIDQAAAVLSVPRTWLRDKVTCRQVPHLRLGRHVRFAPEHLQRIIADGETLPAGSGAHAIGTSAPTGPRHVRRSGTALGDQVHPELPSST